LLSHICVPCPRSYLAYATLISTFYYYYSCTTTTTTTTTINCDILASINAVYNTTWQWSLSR